MLDFYSAERRRVFLEVSSPLATGFRRRMSEAPTRRSARRGRCDDAADGRRPSAIAPSATHLAELLFGAPLPA